MTPRGRTAASQAGGRQTSSATVVIDAGGDQWWVHDARPTNHGFDLLLGRLVTPARQGLTTICTPELVAYLETRRYPRRGADLPISQSAITRLRRLLGLDWRADHAAWWEERIIDICDLTIAEFAVRHGITFSAAVNGRLTILGKTLRPAGWWREPDAAALLTGELPRSIIGERLGISVGSVGRLRWQLKSIIRTQSS